MKKCFFPGDFSLPDFGKYDLSRWAVIACDQFTSSPDYWARVEKTVGDAPSALRLFLPEIYLSQAKERLPAIRRNMLAARETVLGTLPDTLIYVERGQSNGKTRRGIVGVVDLDAYDPTPGSTSPIRASEGLVTERIPPRAAVRRGAVLEMTHILLLIDDRDKTVIEPLAAATDKTPLYDGDLMENGGHIKGEKLGKSETERVLAALEALGKRAEDTAEAEGRAPILYMVGDGNHSLATAKAIYEEEKKKNPDADKTPLRYASVEIVNVADDAIEFEPIYRVLFGVDPGNVAEECRAYFAGLAGGRAAQTVDCVFGDNVLPLRADHPEKDLTVATLQDFIDGYLSLHPNARVDYVHGEAEARALAAKENTVAFLFEGMKKEALFPAVMRDGVLPRKTFSMGEATDKRYYIEARMLRD